MLLKQVFNEEFMVIRWNWIEIGMELGWNPFLFGSLALSFDIIKYQPLISIAVYMLPIKHKTIPLLHQILYRQVHCRITQYHRIQMMPYKMLLRSRQRMIWKDSTQLKCLEIWNVQVTK